MVNKEDIKKPKEKKVEEIVLISSDSDEDQHIPTRALRPKIQKCFKCQNDFGKCLCGKENSIAAKVVEKTMNDPKMRSHTKQLEKMKEFLIAKVGSLEIDKVLPDQWMTWIVEFAEGKGRCTYRSGEKGICPKSARVIFNLASKTIKDIWEIDLKEKFPQFRIFVPRWQAVINKDKLYARDQANYFSQDDVRDYMMVFKKVLLN